MKFANQWEIKDKSINYFVCMLLALSFWACQKPEKESVVPMAETKEVPEVQLIGRKAGNTSQNARGGGFPQSGLLVFKDEQTLQSTLKNLKSKSPEQRREWEKQIGLVSMQSVYEDAQTEGENLPKMLEAYPNALVQDPKTGLLPNTHHPDMALVINQDGLVMVGGHIFQYGKKVVKMMDIKAKGQIKNLLEAKEDNPSLGIKISPVVNQLGKQQANARIAPFVLHDSKPINGGTRGFLGAGILRADLFYTIEAGETVTPVYGNPFDYCIPITCEDGQYPYFDHEGNLVSGCQVCGTYYHIVGYRYETVLSLVFKTHRERNLGFGGTYWELMSGGQTKHVYGTYYVNGTAFGCNLGPYDNMGNIITTLPLSYIYTDGVYRANHPGTCNITGNLRLDNYYGGDIGNNFPQYINEPTDRFTFFNLNIF